MWQIYRDEEYRGHLISIYKYCEKGDSGRAYEVRVRSEGGLDTEGDWSEAIFKALVDSYPTALLMGKVFIDGLLYSEAVRAKK